jgi:hypothetical protein
VASVCREADGKTPQAIAAAADEALEAQRRMAGKALDDLNAEMLLRVDEVKSQVCSNDHAGRWAGVDERASW